jgi:glycosyltransferase involved in cell wall biosynthesis
VTDDAPGDAPALSVVMPAHNEQQLLERSLHDVVEGLERRGHTFEIVVVENGSTDRTIATARAMAAKHPEVTVRTRPHADYGHAMRSGLLGARGDIVIVFDVDYYDLGFVDRVLPELRRADGPAIIVGSKRAPGTRDARPWRRRVITAGFVTILKVGFGLAVSDTHGMKALRREPDEPIVRRCRFGADLFDTELVLRSARAGLVIAEVPVEVEERRPTRTPVARRILRTVFGLMRLRIVLWRDRARSIER